MANWQIITWDLSFLKFVEIESISKEVGKEIASASDISWNKVKFNGTVGSIFMPLRDMEVRYNKCNQQEKTVLLCLRELYQCGVYEENLIFPFEWVEKLARQYGIDLDRGKWNELILSLKDKEFLQILDNERFHCEDVYLEEIVKPVLRKPDLQIFDELIDVFLKVPEVLVNIGNRAWVVGQNSSEEISAYMKVSIKAYKRVLKEFTRKKNSERYAMTQNNLGAAYRTLGEVEEKVENSKRAMRAYEEVLKVRTLERFPIQYAATQNNLGNAYSTLGEVEEKVENSKRAMGAYTEALGIYLKLGFIDLCALVRRNMNKCKTYK